MLSCECQKNNEIKIVIRDAYSRRLETFMKFGIDSAADYQQNPQNKKCGSTHKFNFFYFW